MADAAEEFYEKIKDFQFHEPNLAVFSNVTGAALPKDTDLPRYLKKHLVSPVQFVTEMQNMANAGIDTFVEFGLLRPQIFQNLYRLQCGYIEKL